MSALIHTTTEVLRPPGKPAGFRWRSPGQEEFFMAIGDPVDARTAPPPNLTEQEREQRRRKARELGPKYRTEYLKS
jgi:hypothetical protein